MSIIAGKFLLHLFDAEEHHPTLDDRAQVIMLSGPEGNLATFI